MLQQILKLYVMAMLGDVRSPMPHLFGPPGCGKSSVVEQAADLLGVNLHIINVSRISPLDIEGVQMPHTPEGGDMALRLLTATFWTQLKEGDIVLLDEFLRAFPEVYNGLLDILTSRMVGGFKLPKVFIIGASNTTVAYDKALEDRLLHILVPDPRKQRGVRNELKQRLVDELGLMPEMRDSYEMDSLFDTEVLPMFDVLDQMGSSTSSAPGSKGSSLRNLIGQVKLREVRCSVLQDVLNMNNIKAKQQDKHQFMVLYNGAGVDSGVYNKLLKLRGNAKLTDVQKLNVEINLQLIEMETANKQEVGATTDDTDPFFE